METKKVLLGNLEEIQQYVYSNLTWNEIASVLNNHGIIQISGRTLRRHMKDLGVCKREIIPQVEVNDLVADDLVEGTGNEGYRTLTLKLRQKTGRMVTRDAISIAQRQLDPDGVQSRKKRKLKRRTYEVDGVNSLWHFDGYDKIARFGFAIHGCVDGYSRKIIWLRVSSSNRFSQLVLCYFLNAVKTFGFPERTRSDHGSENTLAAALQVSVMGEDSHIFGASTSNQRIESFWSRLRQMSMDYWIVFLNALVDQGHYEYEVSWEKYLAIFVFGPLVEKDLNEMIQIWNYHKLRKDSSSNCPSGIPNVIFSNPEDYGVEDYSCRDLNFEAIEADAIEEYGIIEPSLGIDNLDLNFKLLEHLRFVNMVPVSKLNMKAAFLSLKSQFADELELMVFE